MWRVIVVCLFVNNAYGEELRFGNESYSSPLLDILAHSDTTDNTGDDTQKVHEHTHYINSYLNRTNKGYAWLYALNNRVFKIKEPRLTLSTLSSKIPTRYHSFTYKTYLVQSRKDWNNQPLYILNEWSAYHNGTEQAIKQNYKRALYSYNCSNELLIYALIMRQNLPRDYTTTDLDIFLKFALQESDRQKLYFQGK
jgi:hypothetical protein